ncbi:uncharacterized protein LOC62_03G003674 [Vanrija pseudolonga]|uniref:Uncharacterized protein n=1 Tax=Vanrija pseudolonga TaxID=143232 RepID=A0AAF0Y6C1_9TREE|nr:hypothetical protein LOC62_03G003674 [Vanrija pseudolonga]
MSIDSTLPERPSVYWRNSRDEEEADVAAGKVPRDEAFMASLFPDAMLDPLEPIEAAYEADVAAATATGNGENTYPALYAAVEKVVLALNDLNEQGEGAYIETGERERLAEWIEQVIEARGISINDMGRVLGFGSGEITDEWRDW